MENAVAVPQEVIECRILFIRGKKVMLDRDLARLYGVQTKVLNQAVKRNLDRFPTDFMFQLSKEEFEIWKSQIVTSIGDTMGLRKFPFAFTEMGIAMLSSVLNSRRAIHVNIQIMRTFTKFKELIDTHKDLKEKIDLLERKFAEHDQNFQAVFDVIKKLSAPPPIEPLPERSKKRIGFHQGLVDISKAKSFNK